MAGNTRNIGNNGKDDISSVALTVGVIGSVAAAVYGLPGGLVLFLALVIVGFTAARPELSAGGTKGTDKTPANPKERKALTAFETRTALKFTVVRNAEDKRRLASAFLDPSEMLPPRFSVALGVFIGLAYLTAQSYGVHASWSPKGPLAVASAVVSFPFAVWSAAGFAIARRRTREMPHPGVKLTAALHVSNVWKIIAAVLAAGTGFAVAVKAHTVLGAVTASFGVLALILRWQAAKPELEHWKELVALKKLWAGRFTDAKIVEELRPVIQDFVKHGDGTFITFVAKEEITATATKLPALTAQTNLATLIILQTPGVNSSGQAVPGEVHPRKFVLAEWPHDTFPDIRNIEDPEEARLVANAVVARSYPAGMLGPRAETAELVAPALWQVTFNAPIGLDVEGLSATNVPVWSADQADSGQTRSVLYLGDDSPVKMDEWWEAPKERDPDARQKAGVTGKYTKDDHGNNLFYFGLQAFYRKAWVGATASTNYPTLYPGLIKRLHAPYGRRGKAKIAVDTFGIRHGAKKQKTISDAHDTLASAMAGVTFLELLEHPSPHGENHPNALTLITSSDRSISLSPKDYAPSEGGEWMVKALIARAFDGVGLKRPIPVNIVCLTRGDNEPNRVWDTTWSMTGGLTLAQVLKKAADMAIGLKVDYLRIAPTGVKIDEIRIVLGASPARAKLAPLVLKDLVSMDWNRWMQDAGIQSDVDGATPKLHDIGISPYNDKIQVLEFELTGSLTLPKVKAGIAELKSNSKSEYLAVKPKQGKPGFISLFRSDLPPLSDLVPIDIDKIESSEGLPFATLLDGRIAEFNPKKDPHLLAAGMSGAGKSTLLQSLILGAIIRGWRIFVIDPMKGAADFAFAEPWIEGIATDVASGAELMEWIYNNIVVPTKNLNAKFGVGSFADLPKDVRPRRVLILIDEFTSLISQTKLPPKSKHPDLMAARDAIEEDNSARMRIGQQSGKQAREARSAGVTLMLGTQKLIGKMLEPVGGEDLKTNLARILLGAASQGDRMSALKNEAEAPKLVMGESPIGRGVWESTTEYPELIQAWYSPQAQLRTWLDEKAGPVVETKWRRLDARLPVYLDYAGLCSDAWSETELPEGFDWVERDGLWFPCNLLGTLGGHEKRVVVVGAPKHSLSAFVEFLPRVQFAAELPAGEELVPLVDEFYSMSDVTGRDDEDSETTTPGVVASYSLADMKLLMATAPASSVGFAPPTGVPAAMPAPSSVGVLDWADNSPLDLSDEEWD
jgi:DNA segregation ATPase FtsK/SpoIIIE, S-DNA-T family